MKKLLLQAGWIWAVFCASGDFSAVSAATLYTNDGVLTAHQECARWYINRARFAPEMEADRLGMTNSTPGGHPNYDACEDGDGPNDFGTNSAQWAAWISPRPPLAPNRLLSIATDKHSRDLAASMAFSHYSPSTNFYPLNSSPGQRITAEGYSWNSYNENITGGYYTPPDVHEALFVDIGITNRGHRKNILSTSVREIGVGRAETNTLYWYYDTHDCGARAGYHFFTDTLFNDANSNGVYDLGEGIGGIEVRLWNGTNEAAWYDVSEASGNLALPISDLPDGAEIQVELRNTNATPKTISIPLGFNTLGNIALTAGASYAAGSFVQPNGITNVGFRNLAPLLQASITAFSTGLAINAESLANVTYKIEYCDEMPSGGWSELATLAATNDWLHLQDSGTLPARFYRIRMIRE